jgi:hypothetical protein
LKNNLPSLLNKKKTGDFMDCESKNEKWNRGLDLFIESVHKPDHELRQCAHNQKCYHELMEVRDHVLEYLKSIRR